SGTETGSRSSGRPDDEATAGPSSLAPASLDGRIAIDAHLPLIWHGRECGKESVASDDADNRTVRSLFAVVGLAAIGAACAGSGTTIEPPAVSPSATTGSATAVRSAAQTEAPAPAAQTEVPTAAAETAAPASAAPTAQTGNKSSPSPTEVAVQTSQPFRLTSNA